MQIDPTPATVSKAGKTLASNGSARASATGWEAPCSRTAHV